MSATLTSASCRRPRNHIPSNWQTYSGMQSQYKYEGVERRALKKIISHPDYNTMTFDYDIALLELNEPLQFSNTIQPICLPSSSHVFPAGMSCWVTGWGALREGGIMHELTIFLKSHNQIFFFISLLLPLFLIPLPVVVVVFRLQ